MTLINRRTMSRLHRQFMRETGPTDVLTFDYRLDDERGDDGDGWDEADDDPGGQRHEPRTLADVLICVEVAAEAAVERRLSLGEEVVLYALHGMLHLAGLDDHTPDDRDRMRAAEAAGMKQLRHQFSLRELFAED